MLNKIIKFIKANKILEMYSVIAVLNSSPSRRVLASFLAHAGFQTPLSQEDV